MTAIGRRVRMSAPLEPGARPWGRHLVVDLYKCDMALIRDGEVIAKFVAELVEAVNMQTHGQLLLERFALDNPDAAGYSAVQLITTSNVTAHFAEGDNTAYVDLNSCKEFPAEPAAQFTADFFGAKEYDFEVLHRGRRRR
jgi:S-adenosylmethionine/arginine decarboxylase-like enzyme